MTLFQFEPIGYLESCFKEKFGIPRQPGLVNEATGVLKLRNEEHFKTALKGLEGFSHLWLIFVFHQHGSKNWKPSVRPPRLGGAKKVGVLASRSPHRPNPIGLSAVAIDRILLEAPGGPEIHVRGIDLLDGTPVLDIKPYLPYADSLLNAKAGWASEPIKKIPVIFTPLAEAQVLQFATESSFPNLKSLIVEILELDPRPSFQKRQMPHDSFKAQGTSYGFKLLDYDVKWTIQNELFLITELLKL